MEVVFPVSKIERPAPVTPPRSPFRNDQYSPAPIRKSDTFLTRDSSNDDYGKMDDYSKDRKDSSRGYMTFEGCMEGMS